MVEQVEKRKLLVWYSLAIDVAVCLAYVHVRVGIRADGKRADAVVYWKQRRCRCGCVCVWVCGCVGVCVDVCVVEVVMIVGGD